LAALAAPCLWPTGAPALRKPRRAPGGPAGGAYVTNI
jgi:hypothetical protein